MLLSMKMPLKREKLPRMKNLTTLKKFSQREHGSQSKKFSQHKKDCRDESVSLNEKKVSQCEHASQRENIP